MSNPFSEIKTALRGYLAAHWDGLPADNPAKVRVNNRGGVIFRKGQQAADNPAVDTRRVAIRDANPLATSSSGLFVTAYELGYRSDEQRTDDDTKVIDQTEWELIRVAARAAVEKLGLAYVTRVRVESAAETTAQTDMTKEGQWSGVATLVIEFQQSRAAILPA
jgi:hypothetical protein